MSFGKFFLFHFPPKAARRANSISHQEFRGSTSWSSSTSRMRRGKKAEPPLAKKARVARQFSTARQAGSRSF